MPITFLSVTYIFCVYQIQMSLFVPFRNVTAVEVGTAGGAEPRRSAAPDLRRYHGRGSQIAMSLSPVQQEISDPGPHPSQVFLLFKTPLSRHALASVDLNLLSLWISAFLHR